MANNTQFNAEQGLSVGTALPVVDTSGNLTTQTITGRTSNSDITITPAGTGKVQINGGAILGSAAMDVFNTVTTSANILGAVSSGVVNLAANMTSGSLNIASTGVGTKTINIGTSTGTIGLSGAVTVNQNLVVTGNLTVNGTTSTIDATNLTVKDALVQLASGNTTGVATYIGIQAERGSAGNDAYLVWEEANDTWRVATSADGATYADAPLRLGAATAYGTVTAIAAATQDAIRLQGRAGGTSSWVGTITPTTLSAARTYTLQDVTGTLYISGGTDIPVGDGGTGTSTAPTAGGVIYGASASAYASTAAGTAGQLLQSNAGSAPSWATFDSLTHYPESYYKKQAKVATAVDLAPATFVGDVLTGYSNTTTQSATSTLASTTLTLSAAAVAAIKVGAAISTASAFVPAGLTVSTIASATTITLSANNRSLATTATSGSGTVATLTFAAQTYAPFAVGASIVVAGVTPAGYNGTFTVTACTTTTVSYANATTGAQTVAGTTTQTIAAGAANLTFTQTIAALAVDGTTMFVGNRVLVKDSLTMGGIIVSDAAKYNGIYSVTATGSTTVPWTLTRTADAANSTYLDNAVVAISLGAVNKGKLYKTKFSYTDTLNTTEMYWNRVVDVAGCSLNAIPTTEVGVDIATDTETMYFKAGAIADLAINSLGIKTIAATAATTYTRASTLYISGAPVASTNATITTPYAMYVAGGNTHLGGTLSTGSTINGLTLSSTAVTATGALSINSTSSSTLTLDSGTTGAVNIGTNANAKTITIGNVTGATGVVINAGTGAITLTSANRVQAPGLSTTWGTSAGAATGSFNSVMGVAGNATWLISGTSGGTFRYGIQAMDAGGSLRIYEGTNYLQYGSGQLTSAADMTVMSATTAAATFDSGTTGAVNIGTNANAKTITIGNVTGATGVVVNAGTGGIILGATTYGSVAASGVLTLRSTSNATKGTVIIGEANAGILTMEAATVNLKVGAASSAGFLKVAATTGVVSIDTATYAASNQTMYIGATAVAINRASADLALAGITSVTGTSTLTLNSTTTSALTIDSGTTGAVNIGTNANAKTITIGNVTGATGVVINAGTGAITLSSANRVQAAGLSASWGVTSTTATGAYNVIMGTSASATWLISGTSAGVFRGGLQLLDSGLGARLYLGSGFNYEISDTGSIISSSAVAISSTSSSAASFDSGTTGAVNIGTNANAKPITIGNATGATGVVINSGTGGIVLGATTYGSVAASGTLTLRSTSNATKGTVTIGEANAGTLTMEAATVNLKVGAASSAGFLKVAATTGVVSIDTEVYAPDNQTMFIGTTSVAINRTSANLALTGISSISLPGATSGTILLQPTATAGTNTITFPATTGNVYVSSGTDVAVGDGGTGTSTAPTQGGIIYGATTSAYASTGVGTTGHILSSNGASPPTWEALDLSIHASDSSFKKIARVATTADLAASSFSANILTGYDDTFTLACTTTVGSAVVTTTSTAGIKVGSTLSGNANIPAARTVASIDSATQFTINSGTSVLAASSITTTFTQTIAALTVDGVALSLNDRVLVKDQSTLGGLLAADGAKYNGIYHVSAVGSTTVPWTLTRSVDADVATDLDGAIINISVGTNNAGKTYKTKFPGTATLNTTEMYWGRIADVNSSALAATPVTARGVHLDTDTETLMFKSGAIADLAMNAIGITTVQATAASTYTRASTLYISGAPVASTNATITTPYAMYVAGGNTYLGGAVTLGSTLAGLTVNSTSITAPAALTLDSTSTSAVNLGTGAAAKTITIGNATGATGVVINAGTGAITLTSANRVQAPGLSGAYGTTAGAATGAFNAVMGVSTNATWLISGTSGGTFRYGIQGYDAGGVLRIYEAANFLQYGSNQLISSSSLSVNTTTTGVLTLDSGTTGAVNLGTGASSKIITVGNFTGTTSVDINAGSAGITLEATAINVMVNGAASAGFLKVAATTGAVSIDTATYAASNQTMYIGTTAVAINRASADLALTGITSVTGTSTLTLNSTSTSTLTIDSGTTGAVNIGTNANAKTITIGNVTGATGVVINSGTGGIILGTTTYGSVAASGTLTLRSTSNATKGTVIVGEANAGTLTMEAATVNLKVGAAASAGFLKVAATTGVVSIDTATYAASNQTMYIGTTAVAINRTTADLALTGITSVTGTSTLTLNSTSTSTLTIDSGTTGAINIGTNANAKTITIGNVTGATGVVINSGTGATFIGRDTAFTNIPADVLLVRHVSSGTPAAGMGSTIAFVAETSVGNEETGVRLKAITTDVTAAAENFDFVVDLMAAGAATAEKFRVASTGNATVAGDLAVNGGDITTTQTTLNLANATVTTLNLGNTSGTIAQNINLGTVSSGTITLGSTSSAAVQLPSAKTKIGVTTITQGGNVSITLPTLAGTLIGTGDSATVTNAMLAGSIDASTKISSSTSVSTGVTYAKMQYASAQYRMLGRISSAAGVIEELTPDNLVTVLGQATSKTGTGSVVLATSPTLATPVLGVATGTSLILSGAVTDYPFQVTSTNNHNITTPVQANFAGILTGGASTTHFYGTRIAPTYTPSNASITAAYNTMSIPTIANASSYTSVYGSMARVDLTAAALGGSISDVYVFSADEPVINAAATKTIGTYAAFRIRNPLNGTAQTISTVYGLHSQIATGTGTRWNLYVSGNAPNALAGSLRVGGVVAPTEVLDVTGNAKISGTLTVSGLTTNGPVVTSGGTGATSVISIASQSGKYLYTDGSTTSWQAIPASISLSAVDASTTYYLGLSASASGSWTSARVDTTDLYYTSGDNTLYATNFNTASDIRLKKNINTISNGLELVGKIRPVSFDWVSSGKKSYGVIAQELEAILPELVNEVDDKKSVNYLAMIGVLLSAVKELNEKVDKLSAGNKGDM